MNKIYFIADCYVDQIVGGGELNNEELYNILIQKGYEVIKLKSHQVKKDFIVENKDDFFIIFNFANLSFECMETLKDKKVKYVIYEHDHKYVKTRNPIKYKNFKAPSRDIINYYFYKGALKVLCQSKFHKDILVENLGIDNVENLSGNIWSLESLEHMRDLSKTEKENIYCILDSKIPHKNTSGAVEYCELKNIKYNLIKGNDYSKFLFEISRHKGFVFLPKSPETLSRIMVEARMMNCAVITNSLVGANYENWFKMKGEELIEFMISKREEIANTIIDLFKTQREIISLPKISIITTFCEAEKYIEHFMDNITSQTIFDSCELVIVDANSDGTEKEIINRYQCKFNNIVYIRLDEKLKPTPCINIAIKQSKGEYITFAMIDDVKSKTCLEDLLNHIQKEQVDLVYGDVLLTDIPNQNFDNAIVSGDLFEHSKYEFSEENMVKCLPGPMPMWRKSLHDKNGFFDDVGQNYADDWEMWLRFVSTGSKFSKLNKKVGLYLTGGRSQVNNNLEQRKEEADLFFKYYYLFGKNSEIFASYFEQFTRM